jgi:long-chain acyl-CoA synthetase
MIIVNGMNVYPRMLEEALHAHAEVVEAAVVDEPHPMHDEIVVARPASQSVKGQRAHRPLP